MDPSQNENNEIVQQIELLLDSMTRSELIIVNNAIVNRIKEMDDRQQLDLLSKFHKGQDVKWDDKQGISRFGVIFRINKKYFSIFEYGNPDIIWKVAPSRLTIVEM